MTVPAGVAGPDINDDCRVGTLARDYRTRLLSGVGGHAFFGVGLPPTIFMQVPVGT
jgi:hypothetical protein